MGNRRLPTLLVARQPYPQYYTRTLKPNPDSRRLVREPHISSGPVRVRANLRRRLRGIACVW